MRILISTLFLLASQFVAADGHEGALTLPKRQADATFNITSVTYGEGLTTITSVGEMDEYGQVYVTFNLTNEINGDGGKVYGQGKGVVGDGMVSGQFTGYWQRQGPVITMHHVVQISDGSQNFDIVTWDSRGNNMTVEVHVLK
jgi:hypothetical protein